MERTFLCVHCGGRYRLPLLIALGEAKLCRDCAEEITVVCADCGTRIPREDNAGDENTPLCQSCFDRHYDHCVRCGGIVRRIHALYESGDEEERFPYCHDCYEQRGEGIRDYSYKPVPVFYGDGPRYFGVELEIDEGGEYNRNARLVMNTANAETERIYCKHDGSLEDGFEIVSHPMSLDYHMNVMPWCDVIAKARELHYTSHRAGTCGLHVHVSRAAFGASEAEQDAAIARILYFFEKHWEELLKFSRRTQSQLEHWAARFGYKNEPKEILDHAKGNSYRYTAVNLTNRATIEFRMFRGTLKVNTFLATLQFVDRVCDVAVNLSDAELKNLSWTTFAAGCERPELVQYLKERRLYVNEPTESEDEI